MRSTDFKRRNNPIEILQEIRPNKCKVNWDRLLYLSILILGLAYIGFYTIRVMTTVEGEGQVRFKKLDIQFTSDVQIIEIKHFEGDSVQPGDTLFWYLDEDITRFVQINNQTIKTPNTQWIDQDRLSTRRKIELLQIDLKQFQQLETLNKTEQDRIRKEIMLDIYSADKLDMYTHREIEYSSQITSIKKEISLQQQYLAWLDQQEAQIKILMASESGKPVPDWRKELKPYVSPIRGTITQILKENYEVAVQGDVVMSIHKPSNLFIKVFYDQKDLRKLHEGDIVHIEFPDGTTSEGVLQRFYYATFELPEEFQKKYEPVTRSIAADIIPLDEIEREKWRPFYKMNVSVYKRVITL